MNSVRKTEAWTAYDGSMHNNERDAILASINTILGTSNVTGAMLTGVNALKIEENLKALMPLFQRLLDPRNVAPKPERPAAATPVYDPRKPEGLLRDEGDTLEVTTHNDPERRFIDLAAHPGAAIELDDIRVGQLVETRDGWGVLIEQITCDNEPSPVIIGMGSPGGDVVPTRVTISADDITVVVKQPEDMMPREDAEERLREISDEEIEMKPDDPRWTQLHKSRILLLRRLERLKSGDDE